METYNPYTEPSALQRYLNGDANIHWKESVSEGKWKSKPASYTVRKEIPNPKYNPKKRSWFGIFNMPTLVIDERVEGHLPNTVLKYIKDSTGNIISSEAIEV